MTLFLSSALPSPITHHHHQPSPITTNLYHHQPPPSPITTVHHPPAFAKSCELFNEEVKERGYKVAGFRQGAKLPPAYLYQMFGEDKVKLLLWCDTPSTNLPSPFTTYPLNYLPSEHPSQHTLSIYTLSIYTLSILPSQYTPSQYTPSQYCPLNTHPLNTHPLIYQVKLLCGNLLSEEIQDECEKTGMMFVGRGRIMQFNEDTFTAGKPHTIEVHTPHHITHIHTMWYTLLIVQRRYFHGGQTTHDRGTYTTSHHTHSHILWYSLLISYLTPYQHLHLHNTYLTTHT